MSKAVNRFFESIQNAASARSSELVDYFVYFVTTETGAVATVSNIEECFKDCSLNPPARIAVHLSEGSRPSAKKFLKVPGGYQLERHFKEALQAKLGIKKIAKETSAELRALEHKIPEGAQKQFLSETIDCFEVGAYRASIIMCWILALDHLFEFVFAHHLQSFNAELAKVTDKRVKVGSVKSRDDFGDIPEGKFVELLRSAGIISNDVRKILDSKLGIRNSSAHPSTIAVKGSKAIEFIDDLIENVLLKYRI